MPTVSVKSDDPVRFAFYNIGWCDAMLRGKKREIWLMKLKYDVYQLWTMHKLDGLWLCEVGFHEKGLCEKSVVNAAIREGILWSIQKGFPEPHIDISWLNSYVQVIVGRRIVVTKPPELIQVHDWRMCTFVVVYIESDKMKREVVILNAHAPDSKNCKLTDTGRKNYLKLAHDKARELSSGRFVLGSDINSHKEDISKWWRQDIAKTHSRQDKNQFSHACLK